MINLKTLNKEKLKAFLESEEYKKMPVVPISRHRAISHINNPRALNEDVLLILAYEESELLGYLGVLPDDLRESVHTGWLSCIWVSPKARGKGIAKTLVETAYEAYHHSIIITNFTEEAGNLYRKLGVFEPMAMLTGKRFYRKMCLSKILPNRYPKTASIKFILTLFDGFINIFWKPLLLMEKIKIRINDIKAFEIEDWNERLIKFIDETNKSDFNRAVQELSWISSFPWIIQTSKPSDESLRYHFSSEEKHFKTISYEVRKENQTVGIVMFSLRNGHLKIPYVFYKSEDVNYMVKFITHYAAFNDVSYITMYAHKELTDKLRITKFYSKTISRAYLKTKEIKLNGPFIIHDGDGDAAFT